jgi:molecular chaperone DnaJ
MTLTDYFNILGLSVDSSIDEIKRAYRHKARLYHPDINSSPEAKIGSLRLPKPMNFF